MRIDSLGSAGVTAAAVRPAGVATHQQGGTAVPEDTTTLVSGSSSVSSLTAQALETAGARSAKVEALRQAVSSGSYTVDPGVVAEALVKSGM